jgi:hypothetical protein
MTKKGTKAKKQQAAKSKSGSRTTGKLKQLQIPGTERKVIHDVEQAAIALRENLDEQASLKSDEKKAQRSLHEAMIKHGVNEYVYESDDGAKYRAYVDGTVKVKIKKLKLDTDGE